MRECDGSVVSWNGTRRDGIQGICVYRKMEFGAYVVNSNAWTGDSDGFYQDENEMELAYPPPSNWYGSSRPSRNGDGWNQQIVASREYVAHYFPTQGYPSGGSRRDPAVYSDRQYPESFRSVNHVTSSHGRRIPSGPVTHYDESNSCRTSTRELDTTRSSEELNAQNVYEGTMVRVKVPEAYSEVGAQNGSVRNSEVTMTNARNVPRTKIHGNHEIAGDPLPVETYRRINDWLKTCKMPQESSATSASQHVKSNHISQNSVRMTTERSSRLHGTDFSVVGDFGKPTYGVSVQSGNESKFANEPRIVAALESKPAPTRNGTSSRHHQPENRTTLWAEHTELAFHRGQQNSQVRNSEVARAYVSNAKYAKKLNSSYYENDFSTTSSEWSSETLSVVGSDTSSYCTDFTPFELGQYISADVHRRNLNASAIGYRPDIGADRNAFVSQVLVHKSPQKVIATEKKPSQNTDAQFGSVVLRNGPRARGENRTLSDNVEVKFKTYQQQNSYGNEEPKNKQVIRINIQSNNIKPTHTAAVGVADAPNTPSSVEIQAKHRQRPFSSHVVSETGQNLKLSEIEINNDVRGIITMEEKHQGRPWNGQSVERPWSAVKVIKTDPGLSLARDGNSDRKELSNEVSKTLQSKPIMQVRNGSLSITIRPQRPTVIDFFENIDEPQKSPHRKTESPPYDVKTPSGDRKSSEVLRSDCRPIGNGQTVAGNQMDNDSSSCSSDCSDAVSQKSEEADSFTRTIIRADVPAKVVETPPKTESSFKPKYSALKRGKPVKSESTSLLSVLHRKLTGWKLMPDKDHNSRSEQHFGHRNDLQAPVPPFILTKDRQISKTRYDSTSVSAHSNNSSNLEGKSPDEYNRNDSSGHNSVSRLRPSGSTGGESGPSPHSVGLPEYDDFTLPRSHLQNLSHTSHFVAQPKFAEDVSVKSVKPTNEKFESAFDAKVSSVDVDASDEIDTVDESYNLSVDRNTTSSVKPEKLGPFVSTKDDYRDYERLQEAENPDRVFTDSPSLVSEVLRAFDDLRKRDAETDFATSENANETPPSCDPVSTAADNNVNPSLTQGDPKKDLKEAMCCQEFVDFPENYIIDPPRSFSDFTITL